VIEHQLRRDDPRLAEMLQGFTLHPTPHRPSPDRRAD
jgi:hypothetical protein